MAHKIVDLVLAAAVADDGTVTGIAYPSGTNQAFFTSGNASATGVAIINGNDVWLEASSQISITYGASTITLTNTSGVTWPIGSTVILSLGYASPEVVTVTSQAAEAALAGSLTGTTDGTLADIAAIALSTSNTYTDAAVNSAVNTAITAANLQIKELQTKVNALITKLIAAGVLDAS